MEIWAGAIMIHDALDYVLGSYWYISATVSPGSYLNMELVDCRALAFLNVFWHDYAIYTSSGRAWKQRTSHNLELYISDYWLDTHWTVTAARSTSIYCYGSHVWLTVGTEQREEHWSSGLLYWNEVCLPHHKIDGYCLTHFQLPKQNKTYHLYGMHFFPVQ